MPDTPSKTTKAAWKRNAVHTVTLHSGAVVDIRIPDLPKLIESGAIPQTLVDSALRVAGAAQRGTPENPSADLIISEGKFQDLLVQQTVVDPKLTEEDLSDIPVEDKEIIVEIATRQRDRDAIGDHIGGLDTSEKFRKFRGIGEFDTALAGL